MAGRRARGACVGGRVRARARAFVVAAAAGSGGPGTSSHRAGIPNSGFSSSPVWFRRDKSESHGRHAHELQGSKERISALQDSNAVITADGEVCKSSLVVSEEEKRQIANSLENCQTDISRLMNENAAKVTKIEQLEGELASLRPAASARPEQFGDVANLQSVKCQYATGEDEWSSCSPDVSAQLQRAYFKSFSGDSPAVTISAGGSMYRFDFERMHQTNLRTKKRRSIRCKLSVPESRKTRHETLLSSLSATDVWVRVEDSNILQIVRKLISHSCHTALSAHPASTCSQLRKPWVSHVYRIGNFALWRKYMQGIQNLQLQHGQRHIEFGKLNPALGIASEKLQPHCATLSSDFPLKAEINEFLLFHGTSQNQLDNIAISGFDFRISNDRCLYGLVHTLHRSPAKRISIRAMAVSMAV